MTVTVVRRRGDLDLDELRHLLRWRQRGVVARRQIMELGGTDDDIARLLRRRELTQVHPGVYVDHTGPLSREQRELAAVLAYWPAALAAESALPISQGHVVHVAVDRDRRLEARPHIAVIRTSQFRDRVDWMRTPPRTYLEHALIDVMSRHVARDDVPAAFAVLAEVCFTRQTSAAKVADVLATRARVRGRPTIAALLDDLATGACSVLERGYLHRVERAHGLPRGTRQLRSTATGRATDQDVSYDDHGVIVELDGRAHHDSPEARDRDALRDLAELATADKVTARVTYWLVFGDPCRTARWVATLLRRRGWRGAAHPCARCRST